MISGDCCWRRTKSIASPERSFWSHSPVLIGASTSLPTGDYLKNYQKLLILKYCFFFLDTQLHIGREELYHYFPPPNRLHNTFPQGQARKRGESWLKCSRQRVDLKKKEKRKICKVFLWDAVTNFSDSLYFGRRTLWFKEAWISITFIISTYHSCAPQLCITKVIKHTKAWFFHFCKPSWCATAAATPANFLLKRCLSCQCIRIM